MIVIPILFMLIIMTAGYLIVTRLWPIDRLLFSAMTAEERLLAWLIATIIFALAALFIAALKADLYHS